LTEAEIQALGKLGSELELLLSAIVLDDFDYRSFGKSVDSVGERQKQEGSDRATVWIPGWKIEHDGSTISPFEWKVYLPIDFKTAKPVWCKKDDSPKLSYPHETPGISSSGAYHLSRYALISKIILAYLHNIAGFESFVHKHSMGLVNYFPPERVLNWGNEIRDGGQRGLGVFCRRRHFSGVRDGYRGLWRSQRPKQRPHESVGWHCSSAGIGETHVCAITPGIGVHGSAGVAHVRYSIPGLEPSHPGSRQTGDFETLINLRRGAL